MKTHREFNRFTLSSDKDIFDAQEATFGLRFKCGCDFRIACVGRESDWQGVTCHLWSCRGSSAHREGAAAIESVLKGDSDHVGLSPDAARLFELSLGYVGVIKGDLIHPLLLLWEE